MTGTLGGILRDVLAGQPSVLMRGDIYVTAALLGATTFVLADLAGLPLPAATAAGFVLGFALRAGALAYGWTLPRYRSRPGRPPNDPEPGLSTDLSSAPPEDASRWLTKFLRYQAKFQTLRENCARLHTPLGDALRPPA